LVSLARALPGGADSAGPAALSRYAVWATRPTIPNAGSTADDLAAVARVRAIVADGLRLLAARVDATLAPALERARRAWDSADDVRVLDESARDRLRVARRAIDGVLTAPDTSDVAAATALEGALTLETAVALVTLVERRLSSLIRVRVRADEELLPEGKPFLALAPALAEAARRWA
jgi:hypothetical protein